MPSLGHVHNHDGDDRLGNNIYSSALVRSKCQGSGAGPAMRAGWEGLGNPRVKILTVLSAEMGRRKLGESDDDSTGDRCDTGSLVEPHPVPNPLRSPSRAR